MTPCLEPGCPVLVTHGRCQRHQQDADKHDVEYRGTAAQRGYDRDWNAVRRDYTREHPFCEPCLRQGSQHKTQIVDHRIALKDGGARLDPANLEAQCRSCHAVKTHREVKERGVVARERVTVKPTAQAFGYA